MRSRVSPRAGETLGCRAGAGLSLPASESTSGRVVGVDVEGVPGRGENVPFLLRFGVAATTGGASLSMVNAKKSSCCNLRCVRIVSNTVEIVRKDKWRTAVFSERASWKRNLHPGSRTRASREGYSHSRDPHTSKAALRMPSAVRRVESVWTWSLGSRMLTNTLSSSIIAGRPST